MMPKVLEAALAYPICKETDSPIPRVWFVHDLAEQEILMERFSSRISPNVFL